MLPKKKLETFLPPSKFQKNFVLPKDFQNVFVTHEQSSHIAPLLKNGSPLTNFYLDKSTDVAVD